ncbi:MAG: gliding motility-associated C-terminal domain-containing protein [Bacteroidales bacterium]
MKPYIIICFLIIRSIFTFGQFLDNPSFEGPPGIAITPPDWLPFNPESTPDTEPLNCDDFQASDGETYLTLVARGSDSRDHPNSVENCQTQLLQPLAEGECYTLSIDLASRDDLGHYVFGEGFIAYTAPVLLNVYGSRDSGVKGELLMETDPVENLQWETVTLTLKPQQEINYLLLEVQLTEPGANNGNILIDNVSIVSQLVSTVVMDESFTTSDLPIQLEASEGSSYFWSPASGLSCDDCQDPEVNSNVDRTYTCKIISLSSGCPFNELYILSFEDDSILPEDFKIPNVFTPNGDGINDFFEIKGLPPYSSLMIFDRSGKEVFRSETYLNEWDGRDTEGNSLTPGTYWYVLITPGLGSEHKGFVYLKRD